MAKVHGKNMVVTLDGDDLSPYCNQCEFGRTADSHDVTTFGNDSHVFNGGLLNGTATIGGFYESISVTGGPRPIIEPLIGTVVELTRQPEGAGSGLPQDVVDVLVTSYNETAPVADMITWTAELQLSGDVDSAPQSP